MLSGGEGESAIEFWEQEAFKDFDAWGEEGYWSVSRSLVGRFTGFWDRDNGGALPDGGNVCIVVGEVVEVGEEGESEGAEVLKVVDGEAIRTSCARATT